MDPLLIGTIGSIGSKLIDRIFPEPKAPEISSQTLQEFSKLLNQIEGVETSEFNAYLDEHGINSWEDMENHLKQLKSSIRDQLEVQIGYGSSEPDGWMLHVSNEQLQLISPRGDAVSIDSLPGIGDLASNINQLSLLEVLHTQNPDASLSQLAGQCKAEKQPDITWNL